MPSEVGAGIQNWPRPRPGEANLLHLLVSVQPHHMRIPRIAYELGMPAQPRELGTTSGFIPLTQLTNTLSAKTPGQRDMQDTDRKSPDYQE